MQRMEDSVIVLLMTKHGDDNSDDCDSTIPCFVEPVSGMQIQQLSDVGVVDVPGAGAPHKIERMRTPLVFSSLCLPFLSSYSSVVCCGRSFCLGYKMNGVHGDCPSVCGIVLERSGLVM